VGYALIRKKKQQKSQHKGKQWHNHKKHQYGEKLQPTKAQELFDDASREVNDARTQSSLAK